MGLGPGFGLSQQLQMQQKMLNVPQMIQAQEMLQLPLLALEQRIQQELVENPALELAELEDDAEEASSSGGGDEEEHADPEDSSQVLEQVAETSLCAVDQNDYSWDAAYDEPAPRSSSWGDEDSKLEALYNTSDRPKNLQDMLVEQLGYTDLGPRQREVVERLVYSLDDDGYLRVPLVELIDSERDEPLTEGELEAGLATLQGFDPPGIAARDLKECLLLQIQSLPGYAKGYLNLEYALVEGYLEDLAANRLPKVAKAMGCDLEDVSGVADFLKTLNPHPGLDYAVEDNLYIVPDVSIELEKDAFVIRLNRGNVPEVRVSTSCRDALRYTKNEPDVRKQLRERLTSAEWIVNALAQRRRTLLNVTRCIVDHQRDFFLALVDVPGPLMMQTVADEVGIDISTVSRAVKEKYADTPRGLVALRDLFTRQVGGSSPEAGNTSNVQIMERIRQLVEEEDPKAPLKDAQIVNLLKADGIEIVRRTVAKYRQNLGIASYSQRKRY